jgi:hypothetical protein
MKKTIFLSAVLIGILLIPSTPIQGANTICFDGREICVDPRFADFWQRNDRHAITGETGNALRVFGYPIGAARIQAVDGEPVLAQPFENVIMQQPLDNTDPTRITLQRVGLERLDQLGQTPTLPATSSESARTGCRLFPETGCTICGEFLNFWESNGLNLDNERGYSDPERIALFGRPVSRVTSDNKLRVQWFERARLQYDAIASKITITPLGYEVMINRPNPPPLPRNNGVQVSNTTVNASGIISARGSGYNEDRSVRVIVFRADGSKFTTEDLLAVNSIGITEKYCLKIPNDALTGIWGIAFEGTTTNRRTIGFFRVVTNSTPNNTCPDLMTPLPTSR